MDEELKKSISDYFESWELAELLGIKSLLLIDAFEDLVLEHIDDIEDMMEYHSG